MYSLIKFMIKILSVSMTWSKESMTSKLGLILGGARNFNFYPGIGLVSFVCVLPCVVSGGGPDTVFTTHSERPALLYLSNVLVERLLLPLQASDPRAFVL